MSRPKVHLTLLEHDRKVGLLLWTATRRTDVPDPLRSLFSKGQRVDDITVIEPTGRKRVPKVTTVAGWWLPAHRAASGLAPISMAGLADYPNSVTVWALASKWVVESIARQQLVPTLMALPGETPEELAVLGTETTFEARWRVAPVRAEDRSRIGGLAAAMPGVARACPVDADEQRVHSPAAALHVFMDAAADGMMRAVTQATAPRPAEGPGWAMRLAQALSGPDGTFRPDGFADRQLPDQLARWTAPATALAGGGRPHIGFRLEEPRGSKGHWWLSFHLISPSGPERISVGDVQRGSEDARAVLAKMVHPEDTLLEALGRCARVFEPVTRSLSEALPSGVALDASEAWLFLTKASLSLERAGYLVELPAALTRVGKRRVRARMRVGGPQDVQEASSSGLLAGMVGFKWEACLGDDTLTASEFRKLAKAAAPLVLHRGEWVAVDPSDVARLEALMADGGGRLKSAEALRLALAGEVPVPDTPGFHADVLGAGPVADALEILKEGVEREPEECRPPAGLNATLRPYQLRGLAWLDNVTNTGFGACLADDMGLGKTIQVLAHFLYLAEREAGLRFLVVCPTSVIGNWLREIQRFTPALRGVVHHGPGRDSTLEAVAGRLDGRDPDRAAVIITSYALVRGDEEILGRILFDSIVLDEAQNIKNPDAAQSQAARRLQGRRRMALTGTPVENRLTELWSIMDFLNSGLLSTRAQFKRQFSTPIERYGDKEAAELLRRVTAPFILRRMKTDPAIAPDLPEKFDMVRYCPLTREQAALYQGTIDRGLGEISSMEQGIKRRGRILAMITHLKQICNHPRQFLKDDDGDPRRSGKLVRFLELMHEIVDNDGAMLVFTQYREMGNLLQDVVSERLNEDIPFFHGGLARGAREKIVERFQSEDGPRAMIISLKAGGTGLNLTRANHVFHYDRWWNPAVEDQATDRAFRIGQTRDVTVHRLVSQGTMEEQIHKLLEEKRALADRVIGAGETWLSELDDDTLHELVRLGADPVLED